MIISALPFAFWTEFAEQIWLKIAVLLASTAGSFLLGRYLGRYQASREWKKKEFFNRLNVSLNSFKDGKLQLRTLIERPLEQVFFNAIAMNTVAAASQRTTADNPMLPIKKEEAWYLLNFVVNAISEHYSLGVIRQDAGRSACAVRYAVFLTCEAVEHGRIRKVRAMLIRPELLRDFPYLNDMPQFEQAWHDIRIKTLRKAAEAYRTHPDSFLEVEICV